MKGMQRK